jgi:hypothetical protein
VGLVVLIAAGLVAALAVAALLVNAWLYRRIAGEDAR